MINAATARSHHQLQPLTWPVLPVTGRSARAETVSAAGVSPMVVATGAAASATADAISVFSAAGLEGISSYSGFSTLAGGSVLLTVTETAVSFPKLSVSFSERKLSPVSGLKV